MNWWSTYLTIDQIVLGSNKKEQRTLQIKIYKSYFFFIEYRLLNKEAR